MPKPKPKMRAKAIALRKQGLSYKEISEEIGVAKSTLSYWLREISLTDVQKERLDAKEAANRADIVNRATTASRIRGGHRVQELYGDTLHRLTATHAHEACMAYRKDELPTKALLEEHTGREFSKERLPSGKYVDFADPEYLIEHTADPLKGLSEAIARLNSVPDDPRTKVLICSFDCLGNLRLERARGIHLVDIKAFEKGSWSLP